MISPNNQSSEKSIIGISKVRDITDQSEIRSLFFNLLDDMKRRNNIIIPHNAKIFIKPNICLVKSFETGATVDPFLIKCLVDWLLKNYNIENITIGEADATQLNIDIAFKVLGWEDIFNEYPNVKLLNLAKDENINVQLDGKFFESLEMSKTYMESDFLISFGKLKTHTITGITCILKNQYGANPIKYKAQYHKNLDDVIFDLNKVKVPNLCIVDGIIAMEGKGPIDGYPKPMGLLLVGNDAVAMDHACARIMGFNPNKISHLTLADKNDLGNTKYSIFGENIEDIKTRFVFVSNINKIFGRLYKSKIIKKIPIHKIT